MMFGRSLQVVAPLSEGLKDSHQLIDLVVELSQFACYGSRM